MAKVVHNPEKHRFELAIEGSEVLAVADYVDNDSGRRLLTHTEVPSEYSGRGLGSQLARAVFDDARANDIKLVPACWFMAEWVERHPDYADVVATA